MGTIERNTTYYKYRSLDNFEFFMDILINKRLHAASYKDMNDVMEGVYHTFGLKKEIKENIHDKKLGLKICSLSRINNDPLMWAHYANGSQGIAIGVKINDSQADTKNIIYTGIPHVLQCINTAQTAKEILLHKHKSWEYEQETRVFTTKNYVDIEIIEIILGKRIEPKREELIKSIVEQLKIKCLIKKQASLPPFSPINDIY